MSIKVENISFAYNSKEKNLFKALSDVSFEILEGEFVAIVGKTGSGKSTLVQTFNALIEPTDGLTRIDDFVITKDKKLKKLELNKLPKDKRKEVNKTSNLRKKVGMVFQFPEYQLFSETVLKDVMFGPKNFGLDNKEAENEARNALKNVGIPESYFEKSPFELSGGEKRRVAIAGILASNPEILVLDEPTAGLDPKGKKEIMSLIKELHNNGKTIILVTHDMEVVIEYATKVIVLNDGKLKEICTPKELFNKSDISNYSLEIPALYKFIFELKNQGFEGFLDEIDNLDTLINKICEAKNE